MTDKEIIKALGGVAKLAAQLGVDRRVVSNWKTRGISEAGRYRVREAARQKRVRLPDNFLSPRKKNGGGK